MPRLLHHDSCLPLWQVYFTKEWLALVETSFRNLVAQGIQHLPLPALLHFNTDRLERHALRKQVDELSSSIQQLRQQSASSTASAAVPSGTAQPTSTHQHQQQQQRQPKPEHGRQQRQGEASQQVRPIQAQTAHSRLSQAKDKGPSSSSTAHAHPQKQAIAPVNAREVRPSNAAGVPSQDQDSAPVKAPEPGPASTVNIVQQELTDSVQSRQADAASSVPAHARNPGTAGLRLAPRIVSSLASSTATLGTANHTSGDQAEDGSSVAATDTPAPAGMSVTPADAEGAVPQHTKLPKPSLQQQATSEQQQQQDQLSAAAAGLDAAATARSVSTSPVLSHLVQPQSASRPSAEAAVEGSANGDAAHELVSLEERLVGHDSAITCCSFSPSGQNLATASTDGIVRIWAPETLQVSLTCFLPCDF